MNASSSWAASIEPLAAIARATRSSIPAFRECGNTTKRIVLSLKTFVIDGLALGRARLRRTANSELLHPFRDLGEFALDLVQLVEAQTAGQVAVLVLLAKRCEIAHQAEQLAGAAVGAEEAFGHFFCPRSVGEKAPPQAMNTLGRRCAAGVLPAGGGCAGAGDCLGAAALMLFRRKRRE
ncbi:hypothetical protein [Bradyrhizobium sp. cf659]|uniref:hypothetical protein n=1 Tax=Bradyrhizobium sp. cf659 TaxID=1761771 RepID=UPI0015A62194|nr:hypothetical protein [Bradyrhizobium sp. cf659]